VIRAFEAVRRRRRRRSKVYRTPTSDATRNRHLDDICVPLVRRHLARLVRGGVSHMFGPRSRTGRGQTSELVNERSPDYRSTRCEAVVCDVGRCRRRLAQQDPRPAGGQEMKDARAESGRTARHGTLPLEDAVGLSARRRRRWAARPRTSTGGLWYARRPAEDRENDGRPREPDVANGPARWITRIDLGTQVRRARVSGDDDERGPRSARSLSSRRRGR